MEVYYKLGLAYMLRPVFYSLCIVFVLPTLCCAFTVSDPTSYTYYVQQLQKQSEEISKLMEQIEEIQNVVAETQAIKDNMLGHYNRAKGMLEDLAKLRERMEQIGPSMAQSVLDDLLSADTAGVWTADEDGGYSQQDGLKNDDGSVNVERVMEVTFKDPRSQGYDGPYEEQKRFQIRMDAAKTQILESDKLLQDGESRMARLEELGAMIDTTVNPKDAQDLTNRYLAEMLAMLNQQLTLTARMAQAEGLLQYRGVDAELTKEELLKAKGVDPSAIAKEFDVKIEQSLSGN